MKPVTSVKAPQWDPETRGLIPGKPGRPSVLVELKLTPERIREIYDQTKSFRLTAATLGIAVNTVRKYIQGPSYAEGRHYVAEPWKAKVLANNIQKWFQDHRTEKLPRSLQELGKISGFTKGQLNWYLKKRRRAAQYYLQSLGDLKDRPHYLVDLEGRRVPCGMLGEYYIKVNRYDLSVQIVGMLRFGGAVKFVLPFDSYRKLFVQEDVL